MALSIEQRVAKGVAWLDRHVPDWPERVKLNRFDISSACDCVLGQVFGAEARMKENSDLGYTGYDVAIRDLNDDESGYISSRYARTCGFDLSRRDAALRSSRDEWRALQREWKRVIRQAKQATA